MRTTIVAVVVVACGLVTLSCSGSGPEGGQRPTVDARAEPAATCDVVTIAHEQLLRVDGATFTSTIVGGGEDAETVGAVLAFLRGGADLGEYGPAIDYLVGVYAANEMKDPDRPDLPRLTAAVRRSADRLDEALAAGMCG